jgi:UDP-N-acetylmuramoyl-L-alanyl-D-glutamate--2,6-diaminopimelate ligase
VKLKDLIREISPIASRGSLETEIRGIAADSREVKEGDLFFALNGLKRDGADFISEALDRRAAGLVVREFFRVVDDKIPQVRVDRPRLALALLSNEFFGHPARKLRAIGVTGTNGKTTVAFLARAILEAAGFRTGLIGTIVYQVGERSLPSDLTTPAPPRLQQLLEEMRRSGCTHAMMEVSSHALDQDRVAGIEFQTAVFTNLSREHLDYHVSWDEYREAKGRLFRDLHLGAGDPQAKRAILNLEDPLSAHYRAQIRTPVITYGFSPEADLSAADLRSDESGSAFRLVGRSGSWPARLRLLGRHNVLNALAAVAVAEASGIDPAAALSALEKVENIPGRLERIEAGQPFAVLVDFAHTPDALENALATLRELRRGRLICVFGCGGDRDRGKRPLMGAAAARAADAVIVTSDNPRGEDPAQIVREILSGVSGSGRTAEAVLDRREAIERALSLARPGDTVLIAGKGHERRQIFRDRIIPFDDREVAREIIFSRFPGGPRKGG